MKRLIELRKEANLTQQDMANILGITRQAYSNYELGNREPDLRTLALIADHFDITIDELVREDEKIQLTSKSQDSILKLLTDALESQDITEGFALSQAKAKNNIFVQLKHRISNRVSKLDLLLVAKYLGIEYDVQEIIDGDNYDIEYLKVALFGGDSEVTNEMWEEVSEFADFVKAKHLKEKK